MQFDYPNPSGEALYEDLHRPDLNDAIASCLHFLENGNHCREIPAHYHDFIEVIYGIRGSFLAKLSDCEFTVNEGDMLLINVNEVHSFHHYEPCEYYCLQFDPSLVFTSPAYSTGARYILPFLMSTSYRPQTNKSYSRIITKNSRQEPRAMNLRSVRISTGCSSGICAVWSRRAFPFTMPRISVRRTSSA